jgi:hypothetical protein
MLDELTPNLNKIFFFKKKITFEVDKLRSLKKKTKILTNFFSLESLKKYFFCNTF